MKIITKILLVLIVLLMHAGMVQAHPTPKSVRDTIDPYQAYMRMESTYHTPDVNGNLQMASSTFWYVLRDFEDGANIDSVVQYGNMWVYGEKFFRTVIGATINDTVEVNVQDDIYNVTVNFLDSTIIILPIIPLYKRIFEVDLLDSSFNMYQIDTVRVLPHNGPEQHKVNLEWGFKPESPFTLCRILYDTVKHNMNIMGYAIRKEVIEPGGTPIHPYSYTQVFYGHSEIGFTTNINYNLFRTERYVKRQDGQFITPPEFEGFEIINLLVQ